MTESVQSYYNRIGSEYDDDRFGSTYGRYIHRQECAFFDKWLPPNPSDHVLDMGCGTGRFMDRATDGVDFSEGMMEHAQIKHPNKRFHRADISETGLASGSFRKAFSMHVLMHLDPDKTTAFLNEAHRLLEPGGLFVVDFPSAKRRSFGQRKAENWHGSNAQDISDLMKLSPGKWELVRSRGILFFPIHRFPKFMRGSILWLDNLFCRSFLKTYASYVVVVMRRK
jgi:ubiquinone/menaquinone biosynthesis C-methylase UbiE